MLARTKKGKESGLHNRGGFEAKEREKRKSSLKEEIAV